MIKETITLYFIEGKSDKFYIASIEELYGKYSVPVRWGRNGTSGQSGFKAQDVSYSEAKKAYDKVVKEKTGKGYYEDSLGTSKSTTFQEPVQDTFQEPVQKSEKQPLEVTCWGIHRRKIVWQDNDAAPSDEGAAQCEPGDELGNQSGPDSIFQPQLLNEIEDTEIETYINNPDYCAQEKHDGRRRGLHYQSGKVTGYNKKGKSVGFPSVFVDACIHTATIKGINEFFLDGEEVGEDFYVFDLLSLNGKDLRNETYQQRYNSLCFDLLWNVNSSIHIVKTAFSVGEKASFYTNFRKDNKEGIVFKKLSGKYRTGYSDDQKKYKFYATASVIVIKHNIKNSIAVAVIDKGKQVHIGNVTMIGHEKPPTGSIIEVKYLYFYPGGSLYQPAYLGLRDDMDASDCTLAKLKVKGELSE